MSVAANYKVTVDLYRMLYSNEYDGFVYHIITPATSSGKRNLTVRRLSVRLSAPLAYSLGLAIGQHMMPAYDAATMHFVPTIMRTDILVYDTYL